MVIEVKGAFMQDVYGDDFFREKKYCCKRGERIVNHGNRG
eukprot:CAMPEP_0198142860 /NCGR_PEP_ID=MMETSP1443-20131203/5530_1 /TAXON_ID=186043 /ORGANISM="Entomoneis sp., Strain CCMP2396" /LENGTH=39 /DNA_ID= /DNA_START= /DNA_END= /DNA_ORIENTATION=